MTEAYWGPSMWVRTHFTYHLVLAGLHVVSIDADVVFPSDPRPILFSPLADLSISVHFHGYFPWVWSFPLFEPDVLYGERTWVAAMKRHFVEVPLQLRTPLRPADPSVQMLPRGARPPSRSHQEQLHRTGRVLVDKYFDFCSSF